MEEPKIESKLTPQTEALFLRERIGRNPERAREIVGEHLREQKGDIYAPEAIMNSAEMAEIEKKITDVDYKEKEEFLNRLFAIAIEKGLLNAAEIAQKINPAIMDEFHDRLVEYLVENQNANR